MAVKLGQIFIELGLVTADEVDRALDIQRTSMQGKRIGEILRETVNLSEDKLLEALSRQFGMPRMKTDQLPDALPVEKVSFDFLRQNLVVPLSVEDNTLYVAVADPTQTDAIKNMAASFDYDIHPLLASSDVITAHIEKLSQSRETVMQRLLDDVSEEEATQESGDLSHLRDLAQDQGIIRLVNVIIDNAIKDNASDIHVEPEELGVRVRYRIDGILYDRETLPLKTQAALASRIKLLSQMNIAERRLPQDGRIRGRYSGKEVDMRVSTLPTIYGESIVMRILDREAVFITLEELGFDENLLEQYEKLIKKPYGMILITGPTGSGKTTTLYASLDKINSPDKKIITIEEPVEYLLDGVMQIPVRPKIGLTFASGLRHIVRQDPDIVMVGEIRDLETAGIAVHASLTGHLLFSTLHTNDAASAVTRLIDMGVEYYLVASTLSGVVAQRLVRKICPSCKEDYSVPEDIKLELGPEVQSIARGKGCKQCMNTGYRGRIALFELLAMTDELRRMVMARASARDIKEKAVELGMRSLYEDGLEKVKRGVTTIEEVMRVTQVES